MEKELLLGSINELISFLTNAVNSTVDALPVVYQQLIDYGMAKNLITFIIGALLLIPTIISINKIANEKLDSYGDPDWLFVTIPCGIASLSCMIPGIMNFCMAKYAPIIYCLKFLKGLLN